MQTNKNKPSFNYKNVSSTISSKKIYIKEIIDNIESLEDKELFKKVLEKFIKESKSFKYKNFDKWFNYSIYADEMRNSANKVQIWINNLIRISKHRNFKLFGIASDTQSLEEIQRIFFPKQLLKEANNKQVNNINYDYKYINKYFMKKLSNLKNKTKTHDDNYEIDPDEEIEILDQDKYDELYNPKEKIDVLKERILRCKTTQSTSLDLSNLRLKSIPSIMLKTLPFLQQINLADNKISAILDDAFIGLKNLKVINVLNNPIEEVSSKALIKKKLPNLCKFYISGFDSTASIWDDLNKRPEFQTIAIQDMVIRSKVARVKAAEQLLAYYVNSFEQVIQEEKIPKVSNFNEL